MTLTTQYVNGTWTVVDESGQRFWPAKKAKNAIAAMKAAVSGEGTWRY